MGINLKKPVDLIKKPVVHKVYLSKHYVDLVKKVK